MASASASMAWIEQNFPEPLPHNGTVCRQTADLSSSGVIVTPDSETAADLVRPALLCGWDARSRDNKTADGTLQDMQHSICGTCAVNVLLAVPSAMSPCAGGFRRGACTAGRPGRHLRGSGH